MSPNMCYLCPRSVHIYGADAGDDLTAYGALAFGDIDGDGVTDLIIGAFDANGLGNSYSDAGEAYVVSGWHLTGYTVDVAVTEILAPSGEVPKDTVIIPTAVVKNLGLLTETFPVTFQIGADYSETVTVTLIAGEIDTVTFSDWTATQLGTHATRCFTALAGDENTTNDMKTGTVIVTPGPGPIIYGISPNQGGNTGSVTVEITGYGFEPGAKVKLTKTEQPDIVADTSLTTVVDSSTIITTFDLRDRELGAWNVVITNLDGDTTIYYSGFEIEGGIELLWVDIIGRDQIRLGEEGTYWIRFGNSGNVDAYDLLLEVFIPKNSVYSIDFPLPPDSAADWDYVSDGVEVDTNIVIPIWVQRLAGDAYYDFRLFITITDGQIGDSFPISVELREVPRSEFSHTGNVNFIETSPQFENIALSIWESLPERIKSQNQTILFQDEETVREVLSDNVHELWRSPFSPKFTFIGAGVGALIGLCFANPLLGGISGAILGQAVDQAMFVWYFKTKEIEMGLKALNQIDIELQRSWDPNDKVGPVGFGDDYYVLPEQNFQYIIYFENVDTATAPALDIVIIDTLDANLDWSTFNFAKASHTSTTQSFDPTTGVITWIFEDIDLPPNVDPPEGEGYVSFSVKPLEDLSTGTRIENLAWITFDYQTWAAPMDSVPIFNTIDALPPSSNVLLLAEKQPLSSFLVQWSGEDDESGSGIRDYEIYVSDNGGPFSHWFTTDSTSAMFTGENQHTYRFYSIAVDNVGHKESEPPEYDAITTVKTPEAMAVAPSPFVPSRGHTHITFFGAGVPGATIQIFNKAGELVQTLKESQGSDKLTWNVKSRDGKDVASGAYIWVLKTPSGHKEKGKFAIIR